MLNLYFEERIFIDIQHPIIHLLLRLSTGLPTKLDKNTNSDISKDESIHPKISMLS